MSQYGRSSQLKIRGFSMLEAIIVITIIAIIASVFQEILVVGLKTYKRGLSLLKKGQERHVTIPVLQDRLRHAKQIIKISTATDTEGYLQYIDDQNKTVTVYKNSAENRASFGASDLFSQTTALMAVFSDGVATSDPELIVDKVNQFKLVSYSENRDYRYVASPNNLTATVNYEEIGSIKYVITRVESGTEYTDHQLITLPRARLMASNSITYGVDFVSYYARPFQTTSGFSGFSLSHMQFDDDPNQNENADGVYLTVPEKTVKIRNTGRYFSTIQEAVNAAVSGNEILVSYVPGGYSESVTLVPGIKLFGGYENYFWTRDLDTYPSVIHVNPAYGHTGFDMANHTLVDGFTIDGQGLLYGIRAVNVVDATVSNCQIYDVQYGLYLNEATGAIIGNRVTGNSYCLYVDSTTQCNVYRNYFISNNTTVENVRIQDASGVDFRNNIVKFGRYGVLTTTQVLSSSTVAVINNIITGCTYHGIDGTNTHLTIYNNAIFDHYAGVRADPAGWVTIDYNLFADFDYAPTLNVNSGAHDIVDLPGQYSWLSNDPYFLEGTLYFLKGSTHGQNPLIDGGLASSAYNDANLDGAPSKGTTLSDIGLYGGPFAGRVGGPQLTVMLTTDSMSSLSSKVTAAFPGDHFRFMSGTFNISTTLPFKRDSFIFGTSAEETELSNTAEYCMQLLTGSTVADLFINGHNSYGGVQVSDQNDITIKNLVIKDCDNGVMLHDSTGSAVNQNTFIRNTNAVVVTGTDSCVTLNQNIIASSNTAITVQDSGVVWSHYTYFYNNNTKYFGSVTKTPETDITQQSPLFYDEGRSIYYLHPSSNAIDTIALTRDTVTCSINAGCFEYFIATGNLTSELITTNIQTAYKTIFIRLYGDVSFPEEYPVSVDAKHSTIQLSILFNNNVVTASPLIPIYGNDKLEYTWDLGSNAIFHSFKIRADVTGYRYYRSPYINLIQIAW